MNINIQTQITHLHRHVSMEVTDRATDRSTADKIVVINKEQEQCQHFERKLQT